MAINFPSTIGQATDGSFRHTASGITWAWDGTTWEAQGVTGYQTFTLPIATNTILGGIKVGNNLTIATDGTLSTQAAADTLAAVCARGNETTTDVVAGGDGSLGGSTLGNASLSIRSSTGSPSKIELYTEVSNQYKVTVQSSANANYSGDVNFTLPFNNGSGGQFLRTDGNGVTSWQTINATPPLENLSNVTITSVSDGEVLKYSSVNNRWENLPDDAGSATTGLATRDTASNTANSVQVNQASNIEIAAAKTYALHKIQTDKAAWITLYTDATSRSNDSNRNETTDPLPGSGVIAEIITTDGALQFITPGVIGWNGDASPNNNVYVKVVNKGGSTQSITVTLHFVKLEA